MSSQPSSGINGILNPSFEAPNQAWDTVAQYGTVNVYDATRDHTGFLSAKLSAPINKGGVVAAFVGQPFSSSLDYNLVNLANSPDSLSVWWYVQPEQNGPYSLRVQILFSDGSTPTYNLGYFYGASSDIAANTARSIYYKLGPVSTLSWFNTTRNVYADLQAFGIPDLSSFQVTRIGFGAMANYTYGETVWVDDAALMFDRPSALFTVNQISSLEAAFDASSSTPSGGATITSYTWDFGDGSTSSSTQPTTTHTYTSPGSQRVTLKVVDSRRHLSSSFQSIGIRDLGPSTSLAVYGPGFVLLAALPVALFVGRRWRRRR